MDVYRLRRTIGAILALVICAVVIATNAPEYNEISPTPEKQSQLTPQPSSSTRAADALKTLAIKGRAPKADYSRDKFGTGWGKITGCDVRNVILHRDLENVILDGCNVISGILHDPYTGKAIFFERGSDTSSLVQIDHVVALSDAWQKGAQQLSYDRRVAFANDPLELLAVDGPANMQKSDGDAATWLPPNKSFRCAYVARQIAVKQKYSLWITIAEHNAIEGVLDDCPEQLLPIP
ncbi:MAG TPA: HNH endonuclease family protein [Candidatus Saccharimonadales bacterium]|nr:HNH endonuclease family protein [Candidatus Saccharimonadales bacterium]